MTLRLVTLGCVTVFLCLIDFTRNVYVGIDTEPRSASYRAENYVHTRLADTSGVLSQLDALLPKPDAKNTTDAAVRKGLEGYDEKVIGNFSITLTGIYSDNGDYAALVAVRQTNESQHVFKRLKLNSSVGDAEVAGISARELTILYQGSVITLRLFKPKAHTPE